MGNISNSLPAYSTGWQDIENLRMTIDYTLEGRTFKSMVEYKNELEKKRHEKEE